MPRFMDVHSGMHGISPDTLAAEHQKDLEQEQSEGVHFSHAWADPKTGKVFCLSEGPDRDAVARVHEKAGHPTQEIYEVSVTTD